MRDTWDRFGFWIAVAVVVLTFVLPPFGVVTSWDQLRVAVELRLWSEVWPFAFMAVWCWGLLIIGCWWVFWRRR